MSIEKVRNYLKQFDMDGKILEFDVSSATVELAAKALGCEPKRIAKTISLALGEQCILVVTAGDAKIDNSKYKAWFNGKAKMLTPDEVLKKVGYAVGGVCPFGIDEGIPVYLDISMKRFQTVFPACGNANSAIELTLPQLEQYVNYNEWVDVCKGWQPEEN